MKRKEQFVIIFFLFLFAEVACAQITFQKTYGGISEDEGFSAQQTFDGGYIVAGNTISLGTGNGDIYLIKTDSIGDTLWTRTFGGLKACNDVQQTTDSGYIVVGYSYEVGLHPYTYLIKLDIDGNIIWTKTFNGGDGNDNKGTSVKQTFNGGYILCGEKYFAGHCSYLIRTDINGDTLWTRIIGTSNGANSVTQCSDSGFIFVGGLYALFTIRFDKTGNLLWIKYYGGSGTEEGNSIQQTFDGGFIIGGRTDSFGAGSVDAFLIKIDNTGNIQWSKTYGGAGGEDCRYVQQTADSGYIFTGITSSFGLGLSDVFLVKTNQSGNVSWAKTFGGVGNERGFSVKQTNNGEYIIVGVTDSLGAGNDDIYLIKTDGMGNSNCNQSNPTPDENFQITQETNLTHSILYGGANTFPTTAVGSGGTVTSLCSSVSYIQIPNSIYSISIFPNPTADNFIITFSNLIEKGIIEIFNVFGEIIITENILNESRKKVNLKNIEEGIYYVKMFDGEKSYCKKLIVQ